MYVRRRGALVEVASPAKVNLFLEVLARRSDGFHELEMLVTPIDRFDTLSLIPDPLGSIRVDCRWVHGLASGTVEPRTPWQRPWGELPRSEENLVSRVLESFQEQSGTSLGARVSLIKRIPAAAGLGGASSDAAAALTAANEAWRVGWSRAELAALGARFGSDIPLFFHDGPAICRGRGERVEPVDGLPQLHLVVARPPEGLSTASVYENCIPASDPRRLEPLLQAVRRGSGRAWSQLLFNRLQTVAESMSQGVVRLRRWFERSDVWGNLMSGSGTACFAVCRHARHARQIAARLHAAGLAAVFVARTCDRSLLATPS